MTDSTQDCGTVACAFLENTLLIPKTKMLDDWVIVVLASIGVLLSANAAYCCMGITAVRALNRRLDGIDRRIIPQYVYTVVQPAPVNGDPV
jgi:hypothetical protein